MCDAGDERRECAHDDKESSQDHGLTTVLIVEFSRLVDVFRRKHLRMSLHEIGPDEGSDGVVDRIPEHGRREQESAREWKVHHAQRTERTGGEQERISG